GRTGSATALHGAGTCVIPIAPVAPRRESVRHRALARLAEQDPTQQRAMLVPQRGVTAQPVLLQFLLDASEDLPIDNCFVLSGIPLGFVAVFTDVHEVPERVMEPPLVDLQSAALPAITGNPGLVFPPPPLELSDDRKQRADLQVQIEDLADAVG